MEKLGELLKSAREASGISIEEMQRLTRISMPLLKALEDNNLEVLPSPVIARGFIRVYCKAVGINEAMALDIYDQEVGPRDPDLMNHLQIGDSNRSMKWIFILAIIAVFIIGMTLFLYSAWNKEAMRNSVPHSPGIREKILPAEQSQKAVARNPLPTPGQTPAALEPQRDSSVAQQNRPDSLLSPANSTELTSPAYSDQQRLSPPQSLSGITSAEKPVDDMAENKAKIGHTIVIEADELTWLQREIDDEPPKDIILHPGERILLHGQESIRLYIGNAGGVRLTFDGKPVPQLGPSGKVVSIEFPPSSEKPRN